MVVVDVFVVVSPCGGVFVVVVVVLDVVVVVDEVFVYEVEVVVEVVVEDVSVVDVVCWEWWLVWRVSSVCRGCRCGSLLSNFVV